MEQLKAYALRKHFFRILNEEGVEEAYHFLLQHPPMVDKLSKVYQDSKDETYLLQLNKLNENELMQSQNEISMLLIHAPWNLSLWKLFANTFSDKKLSLKQEILWFIATKQNNRHGYLQFVSAVRGARQWNLEAIYAQLKLIELSKFKHSHIEQVEFLAQKTYFELDELSQQGEKIRRITTHFSKLIKIPEYQSLLLDAPYFCSFCYFHLGQIKKALEPVMLSFNERDQVLMVNQLLYYDYVLEGSALLETLMEKKVVLHPALIAYLKAQIQAANQGDAMVKPLMFWVKRYPKRVSISLIEGIEDELQKHPNQPLVSFCLKQLCDVFVGDQAALKLYMKSLEWLQDTTQGFEQRIKLFQQAITLKQMLEKGKELLLFAYEHDMQQECIEVVYHFVNHEDCEKSTAIMEIVKRLQKLEGNERINLKAVIAAYRQKDYDALFLTIEQLDNPLEAQQLVELLYTLEPAAFLVPFIPWWLKQPREYDLISFLPNQKNLFERLVDCPIEVSDLELLKEQSFLEEKITLYLRQLITLETFCVCLELKSCLTEKEELVKQILIYLAKQPTHASYSIRYPLLKYLCEWCPTDKLCLTLARCCYRLKKYEEATSYFKRCEDLIKQREDIQIEVHISRFLSTLNGSLLQEDRHPNAVMRQVVLLLMSDRQFVKRRTEIYLYYLKNQCQIELLLWWYHLYRRLHQYELALSVIDHLKPYDLIIYRDVLNHFKTKLEQRYPLNKGILIEGVNQRLNIGGMHVNPIEPIMLEPFNPNDLKTLKDLMFQHDVIRQLPYQEIPFLEPEWVVESSKPKKGASLWLKGVREKFGIKALFSKN